jgi:HD-GYP domain-containing protein (c-di-GMP phosphodiesterase class II)
MIAALGANGVTQIWIEDDLGEGIVPKGILSERLRREALVAIAELHVQARQDLSRGGRLDARALDVLGRVCERVADEVIEATGRPLDLLDLAPASRYLLHHALDSAVLAMLVAARHMTAAGWRQGTATPVRHDAPRSELARLGLGLVLCDVGMLTLPRAVLEDASPLDEAGWELIRAHPVTGSELLGSTTSFVLKGIVRGHHERWGGSGYPEGTAGEAIHYLARVAAVADAYDAMTAERHHRAAVSPAEAWDAVDAGAGTAFDPAIVGAFRDVVSSHAAGSDVVQPEGRSGFVADMSLDEPRRPAVRVREGARVVEVVVEVR